LLPADSENETSYGEKKRENRRHPDERRDPAGRKKRCEASSKNQNRKTVAFHATSWIPAFAGMTADIGVLFNECGLRISNPH
jgi:hypothetical protein